MPHEKEHAHDEARLLYVAMTRAMDELVLTCQRQSAFSAKLNMVCERGRSPSHPNRFLRLLGSTAAVTRAAAFG
jgi:superfamily I DNA/RNA helicase